MAGRRSQPTPPSVLAIFGPTASGKTAVAEAIAERIPAELVSADSMQVYRGLPILTNQDAGARLVGIWPLDRQGTVGEYQRARARGDRRDRRLREDAGRRRRLRALVPGGADRRRAAVRRAAGGRAGRAGSASTTAAARRRRTRSSSAATRVRPRASIANDRKRVVRALELWEAGGTLVPEQPRLWTAELRLPTLVVGLETSRETLAARIRARARGDVRAGRGGGSARRGRRRAAGTRPRRGRGRCRARRRSPSSSARRCASPPTSASGCAGSRASS